MKENVTVIFRRSDAGDIIGEFVEEDGEVLMSKNFGNVSFAEIEQAIAAFQEDNPDTVIETIQLSSN